MMDTEGIMTAKQSWAAFDLLKHTWSSTTCRPLDRMASRAKRPYKTIDNVRVCVIGCQLFDSQLQVDWMQKSKLRSHQSAVFFHTSSTLGQGSIVVGG